MKKRNSSGKYIAGLILLIALCVFGAFITTKGITKKKIGRASNIELGLDLAGGVSITYEVDGKNVSDSDMKDTVYKLQKRVEGYSTEAEVYQEGIQGKVIVSFVIDKAGRVTDPQVVRSVDQDLDREALRVVKALPDWIPGKQRGVAVDVFYTLPIEFRLQSDAETPAVSGKADEQV